MVGIADIVGTAVGTNDPSGLTFEADMRFMSGHFVGTDGSVHADTFGFVRIDVFAGVPGQNQIHDFNPGIDPFPGGLFWLLDADQPISVASNLGLGTASYKATNVALEDYHDITNALNNGASVPAWTTFDVEWSGISKRGTFSSTAQRFALEFVQTGASMTWSASTSATSLHSTGVTHINFAEVAHEQNGVFF